MDKHKYKKSSTKPRSKKSNTNSSDLAICIYGIQFEPKIKESKFTNSKEKIENSQDKPPVVPAPVKKCSSVLNSPIQSPSMKIRSSTPIKSSMGFLSKISKKYGSSNAINNTETLLKPILNSKISSVSSVPKYKYSTTADIVEKCISQPSTNFTFLKICLKELYSVDWIKFPDMAISVSLINAINSKIVGKIAKTKLIQSSDNPKFDTTLYFRVCLGPTNIKLLSQKKQTKQPAVKINSNKPVLSPKISNFTQPKITNSSEKKKVETTQSNTFVRKNSIDDLINNPAFKNLPIDHVYKLCFQAIDLSQPPAHKKLTNNESINSLYSNPETEVVEDEIDKSKILGEYTCNLTEQYKTGEEFSFQKQMIAKVQAPEFKKSKKEDPFDKHRLTKRKQSFSSQILGTLVFEMQRITALPAGSILDENDNPDLIPNSRKNKTKIKDFVDRMNIKSGKKKLAKDLERLVDDMDALKNKNFEYNRTSCSRKSIKPRQGSKFDGLTRLNSKSESSLKI